MTSRSDYFTLTVPFSTIPVRYLEPLNIETEMEYTLHEEKFPGLKDDQHILQPALMINVGTSEDCFSENGQSISKFTEWSDYIRSQNLDDPGVLQTSYQAALANQDQIPQKPTSITDARGDLVTILSEIERYEQHFTRSSNPFDVMPALLSAVTFEDVNHVSTSAPNPVIQQQLYSNAPSREQNLPRVNGKRPIKLCRRLRQSKIHPRHGPAVAPQLPISFHLGGVHRNSDNSHCLWNSDKCSFSSIRHNQPQNMFTSCAGSRKRYLPENFLETSSLADYRDSYSCKKSKTAWLPSSNDYLSSFPKRTICTSGLNIDFNHIHFRQGFAGIAGH